MRRTDLMTRLRTRLPFAAPPFAALLMGVAVPTSVAELTEMADFIAEVKVSQTGIAMSLPNGAALTCFRALVRRPLKGLGESTITVCPNHMPELDPPAPKRGGLYTLYLMRSPYGVYSAFSYAGFKLVGPDNPPSAR
jgi:hypothetical protein